MKRNLTFERVYPHAPERVWRALTRADELQAWLMPNDFEARVGHQFRFHTQPRPGFDGVVHCEVLELDEPRRLAYSWRGGSLDTVLSFTLRPAGGGTHLLVEHTGFSGARGLLVSALLRRRWIKIFDTRLPAVLANDSIPACSDEAR